MSTPKHLLVIRMSAMGDVAMCVPVLKLLISKYPDVKITVVTKPLFSPFFRDIKNVSVFKVDVKGAHKGVLGLYKLSKQLRRYKIDAVADLHNVLRSKILKTFLNIKHSVTIDKGRKEKKQLIRGDFFKPLKSTHQRYIDVLNRLGFALNLSEYDIVKTNPIVFTDKLNNLINNNDLPFIGIAPFAAHKGKMYPITQMEKVIGALSKTYHILLFGGGSHEIEVLSKIAKQSENVTNLAGKLTIDEELDVISHLKLMVAMDSGNGHIAAMLGVKVLTIWGVTHPYAGFTPFKQPKNHMLLPNRIDFPKIPTSIYGNSYPEGYEHAAKSIPPKAIIAKVLEIAKN